MNVEPGLRKFRKEVATGQICGWLATFWNPRSILSNVEWVECYLIPDLIRLAEK